MRLKHFLVCALALTLCSLGLVALSKSRIKLPQDGGPEKLDVSAYPAEMQERYKTFRRICSNCHTLARPLNTTMSAEYWAHYVGIMAEKSPEPITDADAKRIVEFLAYDQEHRKDKTPGAFFPPLSEEELQKLRSGQETSPAK